MRDLVELEMCAVVRAHPQMRDDEKQVGPARSVGAIISLGGGRFKPVWQQKDDGMAHVVDEVVFGDTIYTEPFFATSRALRWMLEKLTATLAMVEEAERDAQKADVEWAIEEAKKPYADAFDNTLKSIKKAEESYEYRVRRKPMKLEEGWMKRQNEIAAAATEKWPEWMKKEAGISQQNTHSSQTNTSNAVSAPSRSGTNEPQNLK